MSENDLIWPPPPSLPAAPRIERLSALRQCLRPSLLIGVTANLLVVLSFVPDYLANYRTPFGLRPWTLSSLIAGAALLAIPFAIRNLIVSWKARQWSAVAFGALGIVLCLMPLPLSHYVLEWMENYGVYG